MPHDKDSANNVMKFFHDKSYSRNLKPIFQEAVDILYRPDIFDVKEDNCGRMLFACKLCNSEMNAHESLLQHHLSGKHQKNCDKKAQEEGIVVYKTNNRGSSMHPPGSLQDRLMSVSGKPIIGLQMLEEYQNRGKSYYRCILCTAHGKLDTMYKHVTGTRHTEKYLKVSLELENSILSPKERDTLSSHIVEKYGINVDYIKIIRDSQFYPYKWEAKRKAQAQKNERKRLAEKRSPSEYSRYSPEPEHKTRRHRSPSPSDRHNSRERSSLSPQPSTSRSRYSESPPRSSHRNKSPSSRGGPRTPPLPVCRGRVRTPPPPPGCRNTETQKVDLDELMVQLNFLVKSQNMADSDIRTEDDLDLALRIMWNIALGLFFITKNQMENEDSSQSSQRASKEQNQLMQKILGHMKNYMGPEAGITLSENSIMERRRSH